MKILYTATVLSHICQFHLPYLEMFRERGIEVHVAARNNLAEKNGLQLRHCDQYFDLPFQRSPKDPRNIAAGRQLKALLEKEHYDVILCNTPMGGIVTRLVSQVSRKRGTRVVYMAHGFHFYKGASKKNWMVYYPIEKAMARLCDLVITITEEDYALAKVKFPCDIVHIHGVGVRRDRYHPVSAEEALAMRLKEGLAEGDYAILCTGELNKNKDQKTLISAAALLRDKIPNLKILLAGNGPTEGALRAQIAAENLEDTVQLLGYRTDLETVVPAMDLIVSCSYREGLPLNILEAMLCRKAVVATVNRGHKELVADGKTGYLLQPGDVQTMASRIHELYTDHNLANAMGNAGFEKAQAYTVDAVRGELTKALNI